MGRSVVCHVVPLGAEVSFVASRLPELVEFELPVLLDLMQIQNHRTMRSNSTGSSNSTSSGSLDATNDTSAPKGTT
jgi:hypothetical protein